jgi:hypothetical protein
MVLSIAESAVLFIDPVFNVVPFVEIPLGTNLSTYQKYWYVEILLHNYVFL